MSLLAHIFLVLISLFLITGSLLNLTKNSHWFIRAWDFPRVFIAGMSAIVMVIYAVFYRNSWWDNFLSVGLAFVLIRQLYMIFPYTPLARKTVNDSTRAPGDYQFTLLISNVLMENDDYDKWLEIVRKADPDILVAVEIDQKWLEAIASLKDDYPHVVEYPLDNYYGMVVYSRLEFDGEPDIRFLVQDDIPSVHAVIILKNGKRVCLHALHPRPPEPIYDQDSTPRDAELVIMGREIEEDQRKIPTIVCGDLNDVAWSYTTQLFLRLSKLLDPRMGRGLYNSFNAKSRVFRYPLDHVFHSRDFELVDLRVLEYVGSDHFPVLISLSLDPEAKMEQEEPEENEDDQEAADELVEEQAEREMDGDEQGHVARDQRTGAID